jgi:hypothetical protein
MTHAADLKALIRMGNNSANSAREIIRLAMDKLTDAKMLYATAELLEAESALTEVDISLNEALYNINKATYIADQKMGQL